MRLTFGELCLLDWVLHFPVGCADREHLEWLSRRWRPLREDVWKGIQALQRNKDLKEVEVEIPEEEALLLMAMVPTTFRWGTGEDVGFSLKLKLSEALWGEKREDKGDERLKRLLEGGEA
jgi:hypothetical protein